MIINETTFELTDTFEVGSVEISKSKHPLAERNG